MNLAATLFCAVTTLLSAQAITVSVDRADVRPVTLPSNHESMFVNGWRPLTNGAGGYDDIGVNVSPSSQLDRSFAPLHPVLGKLQEHMAVSERLKPQKSAFEFNPSSILGSFAVFSAKQRLEGTDPKTLSTEREYSFLVPPPRDALRFELEPGAKKAPSEPYVRSSQFIPQAIKANAPTYYIKPASFSTAVHPFAQARPFVNQYNVQQPQQQQQSPLLPSRQPAKQFDSLKTTAYQQQQSDKATSDQQQQTYDRFQQQHQVSPQVVNGNFYNQINHPAHYKQSTFERDPGFLVHESHEISYVTPSSTFKFRPSYHYDNTVAHEAVTARPQESNKFTAASVAAQANTQRPEGFKQDKGQRANAFAYIADFQKTRYTPDINEVLPKANQPLKFNQVTATPASFSPTKVVYVRPELQQQQYQSSIIPLNINQRPPEVEYETPESVSLKHFNEQQFVLQQQLIQQDRQRLREQEKRRQQELQRQQQEELQKRQQEIKLLEQKQKEKHRFEQQQRLQHEQRLEQQRSEQQQRLEQQKRLEQQQRLDQQQRSEQQQRLEQQKRLEQQQRLEQQKRLEQQQRLEQEQQQQRLEQEQQQLLHTTQPDFVKELHHYSQPYPEEEQRVPIEQYKYVHHQQLAPQVPSEAPFHPSKEVTPFKQPSTVQKFEEVVTPAGTQPTTQEDFQPMIRPYRPQKPFRDQYRRRKPTTIAYETVPTEAPAITNPETPEGLTDVPIQTTSPPEVTTQAVTERIVRTRRPGVPLRRRRPSTTTTTPEPRVSSQEYEEELIKYNSPEIQDFEKKKRVRPSSQENTYDKRPLRKRPHQSVKVYNKEHGNDFDTAPPPRRVTTTQQPFREIATDNYPEQFLKELYSSEYNPSSSEKTAVTQQRESSTETIPIEFYETTVASNLEYYEPTHSTHENRQEQYTQQTVENEQASLEHLFTRTEVNYIETTTAPAPTTYLTTQTTTTTTTEAPTTTTKATIAVPKVTHRTRVRYGNATRPRFSIKDYKSRMEYKNRLAQSTSTEPSTVTVGAKIRNHKNQQAPADPNFKEPSGRYKYMSRSSYRTSSSTTPTSHQPDDNSLTTERSNRFTPKKRVNSGHYYRARVTTSSTPNKHSDQEHSAAQSTARPENVFSSSIRKRPTLKGRLPGKPAVTEMQSVAESGSFATTTLPSTEATANEVETPKTEDKPQVDLSDVTMDETQEQDKDDVEVQQTPAPEVTEAATPSPAAVADSTTPFDLRREEELFAKASQSVADLTSSASALYDKPGMFKAVSPAGENRVISAHLKIATDEPTLPIEAFFHELTKKN